MNNWEQVWNNRNFCNQEKNELAGLIAADGFDSPTGKIAIEDWERYVLTVKNLLAIKADDSVFEVGVGSGAFLYPLYNYVKEVGGIDYSEKLIHLAKSVMPNGFFLNGAADKIPLDRQYNIVLSNSVFFYFPSYDYAFDVVVKMLQIAKDKVAILDVNNIDFIEDAEKIRRGTLSAEEYEIKYKDYQHLYYSKDFFIKIAEKMNFKIAILKQKIDNYNANLYRFNIIIDKAEPYELILDDIS